MNLFLEIVFVVLMLTDLGLTYLCIENGKGVEIGIFAKHYIKYPVPAIAVTLLATGLLLFWLNVVNMVWMLIPAIVCKAWLVNNNWRVLRG